MFEASHPKVLAYEYKVYNTFEDTKLVLFNIRLAAHKDRCICCSMNSMIFSISSNSITTQVALVAESMTPFGFHVYPDYVN